MHGCLRVAVVDGINDAPLPLRQPCANLAVTLRPLASAPAEEVGVGALQFRARIGPQLLAQRRAKPFVCGQRLGGVASGVEGLDQHKGSALAQRRELNQPPCRSLGTGQLCATEAKAGTSVILERM